MTPLRTQLLGWEQGRAASGELRRARQAARLTNKGLGDLLGVSASWVHMRETGAVRMAAGELEQATEAIGAYMARLSGGGAR